MPGRTVVSVPADMEGVAVGVVAAGADEAGAEETGADGAGSEGAGAAVVGEGAVAGAQLVAAGADAPGHGFSWPQRLPAVSRPKPLARYPKLVKSLTGGMTPGTFASGKIHSPTGWMYCPAVMPLLVSFSPVEARMRYSLAYFAGTVESARQVHLLRASPAL